MKDENDGVRIKAIECCSSLAAKLVPNEVAEGFLVLMRNADPEKKAWRIRYALAETLPQIFNYLGLLFYLFIFF